MYRSQKAWIIRSEGRVFGLSRKIWYDRNLFIPTGRAKSLEYKIVSTKYSLESQRYECRFTDRGPFSTPSGNAPRITLNWDLFEPSFATDGTSSSHEARMSQRLESQEAVRYDFRRRLHNGYENWETFRQSQLAAPTSMRKGIIGA